MKPDQLRLQIASVNQLLKALRADLRAQEKETPPPRPPRPVQASLPAIPAAQPPARAHREATRFEKAYEVFQGHRRYLFEEKLKIAFEADRPPNFAVINTALRPIFEALDRLAEEFPEFGADEQYPPEVRLFDLWWQNAWASSIDPAFAFNAFCSPKVWQPMLATLRADLSGHEAAH